MVRNKEFIWMMKGNHQRGKKKIEGEETQSGLNCGKAIGSTSSPQATYGTCGWVSRWHSNLDLNH